MAYVFTDTITSLPYGYQLRVVLRSDGATGTSTTTNGGFIISVGEIERGIDIATGDYKVGSVTLNLLNTVNMFSGNVFTASATAVQCEIAVSYDAGSTWQFLFYGLATLESLTWEARDTVETRNKRFTIRCDDALLQMKRLSPSAAIVFAGGLTTETSTQTLAGYNTTESGAAYFWHGNLNNKFVTVTNVIEQIIKGGVDGTFVTPPSAYAFDWTACTHKATNTVGGTEYPFSEWYVWNQAGNPAASVTMFDDISGTCSFGDAKSAQEQVRRMCEQLLIIPIPSYDGTTFTVTFIPRFQSSYTAITGTLPTPISLSRSNADWVTGGSVTTDGLPTPSALDSGSGGARIEVRNYLCTTPTFAGAPVLYTMDTVYITPPSGGSATKTSAISARQVFLKNGTNDFRNANHIQYPTMSVFLEGTTAGGYYGFQQCIFHVMLSGGIAAFRTLRNAYEVSYKTLIGSTIEDIRILKGVTVNSESCYIENVKRDVMKNTVSIRAMQVPS